ncbi:MAG TPA: hypothetical protein PLH57_02500 [Oligoflexia bacterium]|nr:hypothetical protein [Oligoflexia bacterium]
MAKQRQSRHLVVQYIERVRSEIFEVYHREIKKFAKGRNGIYTLYSGNKLYYVGLASSLTGRINGHLRDRHKGEWDTFSMYLTADPTYLKEIESLILRIVDLKGNRVRGKLKNALDLRRELLKELKYSQKTQLDFLMGRTDYKRLFMATKHIGENQTELIRYGLGSTNICAKYKGKTYQARIDRNGWVLFKSKKFSSLSAAGIHILNRSCNGWTFWMAKSRTGKWEKLDAWR